jgi:hypothetical protein
MRSGSSVLYSKLDRNLRLGEDTCIVLVFAILATGTAVFLVRGAKCMNASDMILMF